MKLFHNARIYSFDHERGRFLAHASLLVEGQRIAALDVDPSGIGVERIDLAGATVLPAFADCHAHLTDTGYFIGPHSLKAIRSYAAFGDAVFGGLYDESAWRDGALADAHPLERVHPDAFALLARIDGHSCVVNAKTLASFDFTAQTSGIERDAEGRPTGKLFLDANWHAQAAFLARIPLPVRRAAERRAVDLALSRGMLHLHAQLVGFARAQYAQEVAAMRALPAKIHPKICEPDASLALELGLPYIGGDVFLDGSLGSRTAALSFPYSDTGSCGALRFSDDELLAYYAQAEALGVAAGVHAIGDAAIEQSVRVWERVLGGRPSPRGCRHFIEHFELATREQIAACARMGIYVSMQPQFDALWGNDGGMYDVCLGTQRKRSMNALAAIDSAGATICGGSDAPVCEFDALAGMQACVAHHEPSYRLSAERALALYTIGAARFGYEEQRTGNLAVGLAADLAVLDDDPLRQDCSFADRTVLQTWRDGTLIYNQTH
jgi:hypothetical protein